MTATRDRQSFVGQITDSYLMAAVFALDSWADCQRTAMTAGDEGQRVTAESTAKFWDGEADRCEAIAMALAEMAP